MKTSKLCLTLICSLIVLSSNAQINEKAKGYILKNNGDTIQGYIKIRNDIKNTQKCLFSQFPDSAFTEYTTNEISAYRIENGKYYVSKSISLNNDTLTLFVEYLVDGAIDLYFFRLKDKERYILEKPGERLTVIEGEVQKTANLEEQLEATDRHLNSASFVGDRSEVTYATKKISQGQLAYLMKEDPAIQTKIQNIHFDQKSMINLSKSYHKHVCSEYECIDFNKATNEDCRSIGLYIGGTTGSMRFDSDNSAYRGLSQAEITRYFTPVIGINFNSKLPFVNSKLCADVNLFYTYHQFEYDINTDTDISHSEYRYDQVSLSGLLGYYFIKRKKIELYPSLGLQTMLLFSGENHVENIMGYAFDRLSHNIIRSDGTYFFINVLSGINFNFKLNQKYILKSSIIYERTRSMDAVAIISTNNMYYFTIGINKNL